MEDVIRNLSVWVVPILAAVILHEIAHGAVAYRLGDPTAARMGRLTLNPISHIDPFGTIALPLLLIMMKAPFVFGWAKPVPVNFSNLRQPKRDMVLVALAGPMTNIVLAIISAVVLHAATGVTPTAHAVSARMSDAMLTPIALMAQNSVIVNIVLAVFNLLPILPLDGGRVLAGLLPRAPALALQRLEPYGMFIVLGLLMTKTLDRVIGPVVQLFFRALL